MDETSLRAHLELAVSAEPPLGPLVGNALRAGHRLRRRRRAAGAAGLSAVAVVLVGAVPLLTAGGNSHGGRPHPAASEQAPETGTAYVTISSSMVVPVDLATHSPGTPIRVPQVSDTLLDQAATSRDGGTVYEVGETGFGGTVTPIRTATNTAGPTIPVKGVQPDYLVLAPDGKTAYLSAPEGLFRISTATNTASRVTNCSRSGCRALAITPDGKTLYVLSGEGRIVLVIRTATDTVLTRIELPADAPGGPFNIAISPDGKTAYVVNETWEAKPGGSSVTPISLATNTALTPIKIWARGVADALVFAPGGRTAYVLSTRGVTVIDTATNQSEATISLPPAAGYAYAMAMAPDGKTLYVLTPRGIVPIRIASGAVLPTISVPKLCASTDIVITPDSNTIYVGACIAKINIRDGFPVRKIVGGGVVPISTATRTAGRLINLGAEPLAITLAP
jgi:YVTN family beta-propeller protein